MKKIRKLMFHTDRMGLVKDCTICHDVEHSSVIGQVIMHVKVVQVVYFVFSCIFYPKEGSGCPEN